MERDLSVSLELFMIYLALEDTEVSEFVIDLRVLVVMYMTVYS
jgi:hypothetical protein